MKIKKETTVTILSFDDIYKTHHCDILLNHNIYAKKIVNEKNSGIVIVLNEMYFATKALSSGPEGFWGGEHCQEMKAKTRVSQ